MILKTFSIVGIWIIGFAVGILRGREIIPVWIAIAVAFTVGFFAINLVKWIRN